MSVYVTHNWSTGEDFDEAAVDGWEGRIDDAFEAHETTQAGLASDIADHETRVGQLEDDMPRILQSANSPANDTYTLQSSDVGAELHTLVNANAKTWTLPNLSDVQGSCIFIGNNGTGTLTIVEGSGVTIRSRGGVLVLTEQWALARLRKEAAGLWRLSGEIG